MLPFLFEPNVTQFASVSFPVGMADHNFVLFTKASATTAPDEHHENVRSDAQKWPSLLAEVQKLDSIGIMIFVLVGKTRENKTF
jgi:hypothetical protein